MQRCIKDDIAGSVPKWVQGALHEARYMVQGAKSKLEGAKCQGAR